MRASFSSHVRCSRRAWTRFHIRGRPRVKLTLGGLGLGLMLDLQRSGFPHAVPRRWTRWSRCEVNDQIAPQSLRIAFLKKSPDVRNDDDSRQKFRQYGYPRDTLVLSSLMRGGSALPFPGYRMLLPSLTRTPASRLNAGRTYPSGFIACNQSSDRR